MSKPAVWRWQDAFMEGGVERLTKDKGKGPKAGKTPIDDDMRLAILTKTAKEKFAEKVVDIVGLHLDPLDKAVVLCVDEKSQIQALDRTQPGLPMKKGRAAMMTHDDKRNGTTTLFAALDVKTGIVTGECKPRHRAKEFIAFLKRIDRTVKKHLDLHLVMDNYAIHKTPEVNAWLAERNARLKPFKWTAKADTILDKNARARSKLEQINAATS